MLSEQDSIEIARMIVTSAEALRHSRTFWRSTSEDTKLLCLTTAIVQFFDTRFEERLKQELERLHDQSVKSSS